MMLIAAAAATLLGLTELPAQTLPAGRCYTFLWTRTAAPVRIAMLDETAQTLRLNKGKQMMDIARIGPGTFGGHGYIITLNLDFADQPAFANGTLIDAGSMRVELRAPGQESLAIPVGGIRSCN